MVRKDLIQRDPYLLEGLKREISVMQKLKGNNVVRLLDMLESSNNYYIVQEYCRDGDLQMYLKNQQYLTEVGALRILTDILSGFIELLKQGIIHRDLKPANILIDQQTFKIGDFGFAKCMQNFQRDLLESKVGTPLYMAPQILMQQRYSSKCDIWSIGCIFYECIFRRPPWYANSVPELINNIMKTPLTFPGYISADSKHFLSQCLTVNEDERIEWNMLYSHPVFQNRFQEFVDNVKNLEAKAEFILSDLRQYISANRIDILVIFRKLQIMNNQHLTFKELQNLLNEINPTLSRQEIEFVFNMIDVDKNNKIDFLEFQKCLQEHRVRMSLNQYQPEEFDYGVHGLLKQIKSQILEQEISMVKLFKQFDVDNNKILDITEFAKLLRPDVTNEQITLGFQVFDDNSNGHIDYHEFKKGMDLIII